MTFRRLLSVAILVVVPSALFAEDKAPTAAQVQELQKKYQEERAAAVEKKFPPSALERADEQAERAAAALKEGDTTAAARLLKEARWLVPYVPTHLPPHVDRVLGIARMRHGDAVLTVVFSPDGRRLATASKDGLVKVWDMGNGHELRTYRGSGDPVKALAWSGDGKLIASTAGNEIHLWDPATGKLTTALKGHEKLVTALAFAPDSASLASGSEDTSVRVWNVGQGAETANLNADFDKKSKAQINDVAFSPNGKLVAAVNGNGLLQVWNPSLEKSKRLVSGWDAHPSSTAYQVAFGKDTSVIFSSGSDSRAKQWIGLGPNGENLPGHPRPTPIEGHNGYVTALAATPDGKFLATGSTDKTVRLWDLTGPSPRLARVYQGHTEEVTSLAFSPDGQTLASGSTDQSIRLWTVALSDEHRNYPEHTGYVWTAAFSPDGKLFADAGADRVIYVRDAAGKVLHKLEGHTAPVTAIAFNADGTRLASVGGDQVVRIWDVTTGKPVKEFKGHTAPVMAVSFGGPNRLLTGGIDKVARLWDLAKDEPTAVFPANKSMISAVALRADGKQALVGSADGMLRVFDVAGSAPKETAALSAHLAGVGAVVYGPDGTKAATSGGDGLVKYWNLPESGPPAMLAELKGHDKPVSSVAFSADGRFLVSGGGDTIVRVWDLAAKNELRALRGHTDWVSSVAFGPGGRKILTASVDKTVKMWELSGEETAKPIGHSRALNTVAVSGDGKWVATGSQDRTIKIWDAEAGTEAFTLDTALGGHDDEITALAFDTAGKRLLSGGRDEKLILWDLAGRKPLQVLDVKQVIPYILGARGKDQFIVWQNSSRGGSEMDIIKTYDIDAKPVRSLEIKDRKVQCMTFSTDGELVALGFADGSVQLWNLKDNSRVGGDWAAFNEKLGDIALTPDKTKVIASDIECNIKVYDIAKKAVLKTFQAHKAGLNGILIGPAGNRFASISDNGEVRVWDTDTGKELRSWVLPTPVRNLAFSADGKKLITANGDTTLYVLNLP